MIKNVRNIFLFVLAVVLLSGCLRYEPFIYPDDALEPTKGYIYGRFGADPGLKFDATQMGVVVTSVGKKRQIALRFERSPDPYAVAVDPGDYQVTHIVYTHGADNSIRGEKPLPADLASRVIHVEAGKAYYIGDYDGASKSTFLVLFIAHEWRLGKVANEFAGTTAKLEELLPKMKGMPKVDVFGDSLVSAFSSAGAPKADVSSSTAAPLPSPAK